MCWTSGIFSSQPTVLLPLLLKSNTRNPYRRVLLGKLSHSIRQEIPYPWWKRKFITVFTKANSCSLSWVRKIHSPWNYLSLKLGPICCPETSATNYNSTLRKIPEDRRSHLRCSGSLKQRTGDFSSHKLNYFHNFLPPTFLFLFTSRQFNSLNFFLWELWL
jgi:hypothetical protein